MGTKYATIAVSGYNASPPADDGTQTAANLVKWSTHKTKLGDPLNTAIASINSALVSALDNSARSISANDSAVAGDNARTLEVTGTTTITLMLAATAGAGYWLNIVNAGSNTVTVAPTATDTIDGVASSFTLPAGTARALIVNSGLTGYNTLASYNVSKNHTVQGTLAVTGAATLSSTLGVTGAITASGGLKTNVAPSSAWGIDQAQASQLVTIANNGTYDLAAGSGLVIIHSNTAGTVGMFLCAGGVTTLISDPASVFSVGSGTANKTNFYYNGTTAYRIENKTGGSVDYYVTTIKTRAST